MKATEYCVGKGMQFPVDYVLRYASFLHLGTHAIHNPPPVEIGVFAMPVAEHLDSATNFANPPFCRERDYLASWR
jgi:hypothetical protein